MRASLEDYLQLRLLEHYEVVNEYNRLKKYRKTQEKINKEQIEKDFNYLTKLKEESLK